MPAYEWDHDLNAFAKQCSHCKEVFVGTEDETESFQIFLKSFVVSNGRAQTADGLQSRCRPCNNYKRRELGVTMASLEKMWLEQQGKCAICTNEITLQFNAGAEVHAHVDHDTETLRIRGLLCGNCNRGIGCLKHNEEILKSAITYLEKKDE